MVLSEYVEQNPGFRFSVLATDICTTVLDKAEAGVFKSETVLPVPSELRRKYFMRSRDPGVGPASRGSGTARADRVSAAEFHGRGLRLGEPPEIIFCRNVIIYFDRETQVGLLRKLIRAAGARADIFSPAIRNRSRGWICRWFRSAPAVYRKIAMMAADDQTPPDVDLQPWRAVSVAQSGDSARPSWGRAWASRFWSRGWDAGALCHGVLPTMPADCRPASNGREGVATWISAFATSPVSFTRWGPPATKFEVKIFGGADVLSAGGGVPGSPR